MTKLIPSLNSCLGRMTAGEKRVARLLESHLEDDYLCWYEPTVGNPGRIRYTDFIILHPSRGLLLLEVKDWKMSSLRNVDRQFFRLMTDSGLQSVQHPLEQVRQCTYRLIDGLRRDPVLTHEAGCYAGKLVCPYAFGVVFTAITRQEFDTSGMEAVLPENLVICRDEMTESVDPEVFQKRLWDMGEKLNEAIRAAGLPVHWLKTSSEKKRLASAESTIKLMTMHSSKGLEFPLVIVSGVGSMPGKNADSSTEAKLLYVAMTRATEKLLVTAHQASEFAEILAA
ncbi:MAG: 3'-5' exonuclease [Granulosicoccus sp.]